MVLINICDECKYYRTKIEDSFKRIFYDDDFNSIASAIGLIEIFLESDVDEMLYSAISKCCEKCEPEMFPSIYNKKFYRKLKDNLIDLEETIVYMENVIEGIELLESILYKCG